MTDGLKDCPFWAKVAVAESDQCWLWKAAKNAKGYGNFRSRSAHVVAYEMTHGPIPKGLTVDHLCSVRGCVNPTHLEAVTLQENIRRHTAKRTHCKNGHPLSGENVVIYPRSDGVRRRCIQCERGVYRAEKYAREKARATLTARAGG